jgi:hypothetical protein
MSSKGMFLKQRQILSEVAPDMHPEVAFFGAMEMKIRM